MNTEANRKTEWVVGIGEALWDILPEGRKIGGAPANFAYHMSQFGLRSCAVSAVGDDEAGRELRNQLREKRVGHMLETVPFPTGTVEVTLDGAGIPSYEIRQGVAWDNIPFTPQIEELARHTRAACFGSLAQRSPVSHRTIGRFLETMPDGEGQYKVFDINLRQHFYTQQVVEESLRKCIPSIPNLPPTTASSSSFIFRMLHFRNGGDAARGAVPHAARQVRVADRNPHLRCRREFGIRPRHPVIYPHAAGRSGRHSRRRGLVHGIVPGRPALGARHRGSTQAGRGCRGPRLLAARRHAPSAGTVYRSAAQ